MIDTAKDLAILKVGARSSSTEPKFTRDRRAQRQFAAAHLGMHGRWPAPSIQARECTAGLTQQLFSMPREKRRAKRHKGGASAETEYDTTAGLLCSHRTSFLFENCPSC